MTELDDLADTFSDVLNLADWEAINADFEDLTADRDEEITATTLDTYALTVVCETEEARRKAAATIIDLPGITDVRHKQ